MFKRMLLASCLLFTMQLFQGFATSQTGSLQVIMYGHEYYAYGGDTYLINIEAQTTGVGVEMEVLTLTVTRMSDCQDMGYCNYTGTLEKHGAYIWADLDIDMCGSIVFPLNGSLLQGSGTC